jgi:hypothetical protein
MSCGHEKGSGELGIEVSVQGFRVSRKNCSSLGCLHTDDSVFRHGVLETGTAFLQKPFMPASLAHIKREVLDAGREANS